MRHRVMAAIVVVAFLLALVAVAIYAAFPAPPGTPCSTPHGLILGGYQTAPDHSQAYLLYPLSSLGSTGYGVVNNGCTLTQDALTLAVDGPRTAYVFAVSQFVVENVTTTHGTGQNYTTITQIVHMDVQNETVTVPAVAWQWSVYTFPLPSVLSVRSVTVSLNNSTAVWSFNHMTPHSLLPIGGSVGDTWTVGIELLIVGVILASLGFIMGRVTIRRLGIRPKTPKLFVGALGIGGFYVAIILSDWPGVSWALGSFASYAMVGIPAFLIAWLFGIPEGESYSVRARRHLPDVDSAFDDKGGGR